MIRSITQLLVTVALAPLALVPLACTQAPPPASPAASTDLASPQAATFDVPPKQLFETIQQVITAPPLSLTIEHKEPGIILTSYKEGYQGNRHIVRYWQERTRFRIAVIPDWDNPTSRARVEVTEQTQQRSNPRADWEQDDRIRRPDRAAEVLDAIRQQTSR